MNDESIVLSVNVSGGLQTVQHRGKWLKTGIFKHPVDGPVFLSNTGLRGDLQADSRVHGGTERAAYAYAAEDYTWWQARLGKTLPPGTFGENLTLQGFDVNAALIGERWKIGNAVVQVMSPRLPCFKLGMAMHDQGFIKRFSEALRLGAYLAVVQQGDVSTGDSIEVVWQPDHELTIREMARIYLFDREKVQDMMVPQLPHGWLDWVAAETKQ